MAEETTTEDTQEPRKFKDRKEYLEFIAEQKALKDKEAKASKENVFEEFDKNIHIQKKEKRHSKEANDLRSILTAVNNNNKLSNQILAKLNQKIAKESTSIDVDKFKNISDKVEGLANTVSVLTRTAESLKIAILERRTQKIANEPTNVDKFKNISDNQKIANEPTNVDKFKNISDKVEGLTNTVNILTRIVESPINTTYNGRPEPVTKIIDNRPQYITNIRQYQYKRNPKITTTRKESVVSGMGRKVGTYIGGRGLGAVIAKSIRIGEKTTGAIIKAPFKVAAKVVKGVTGNNSRNALIRANRTAETSKFRKKMLDLLGIISKKDSQGTQNASTAQTSSSNWLPNLLKIGAAAALAGGIASAIPAIRERFTKNEDGTFGAEHKGGTERIKHLASGMAESAEKILKSFGQGVKEAADKQLLEFGENNYKRLTDIQTKVEDFSKSILDTISNAIDGVYKKLSGTAGKVADTAMDVSSSIYNTITKAPEKVADMVKNSPPAKGLERLHNEHVAQSKMPDYVSGMKDSNKFVPNKEYNNIASSLNKPVTSMTLKQLESQQKQSDDLQRDRNKKALEPIIINNTNNTTKESPKQPSMIRLGTRNLDSSKQQLDRSILTGGYIGTGFLVN